MTDQAPEMDRIFSELDDIKVDQNGNCRWVDIANAQTLMKLELRSALSDWMAGAQAALTRPPSERPVAQVREVMWRDIAETLCAVDGNGFLHEASPTQQAAYEVRAKAVENLTAEEFAQVLPRPEAAVAWRTEIEIVGWAILQALHDGVEDGPQSWSDMASDQEKRIKKAAIAAIESVTDLSQYKAQGFSLPRLRPVAFRVARLDSGTAGQTISKTEWRLFNSEAAAREAAEAIGVDYQGLYVRDSSLAIQHEEPGRETMTSVTGELEMLAKDCEELALDAQNSRDEGLKRAHLSIAYRIRHAVKKLPYPLSPAQRDIGR